LTFDVLFLHFLRPVIPKKSKLHATQTTNFDFCSLIFAFNPRLPRRPSVEGLLAKQYQKLKAKNQNVRLKCKNYLFFGGGHPVQNHPKAQILISKPKTISKIKSQKSKCQVKMQRLSLLRRRTSSANLTNSLFGFFFDF